MKSAKLQLNQRIKLSITSVGCCYVLQWEVNSITYVIYVHDPSGSIMQDNELWVRETLLPIPTRGNNQNNKTG